MSWKLPYESLHGRVPSSIGPYKYLYGQKNEMEQMVEAVIGKSTVQEVEDRIEH